MAVSIIVRTAVEDTRCGRRANPISQRQPASTPFQAPARVVMMIRYALSFTRHTLSHFGSSHLPVIPGMYDMNEYVAQTICIPNKIGDSCCGIDCLRNVRVSSAGRAESKTAAILGTGKQNQSQQQSVWTLFRLIAAISINLLVPPVPLHLHPRATFRHAADRNNGLPATRRCPTSRQETACYYELLLLLTGNNGSAIIRTAVTSPRGRLLPDLGHDPPRACSTLLLPSPPSFLLPY